MMSTSTVRSKGRVTIPSEIRKAAHIEEGMVVEFLATEGGILLKPKLVVDADQAWFWTPEWQAKEGEADSDIKSGGGKVYESEEEFKAALDSTRGE